MVRKFVKATLIFVAAFTIIMLASCAGQKTYPAESINPELDVCVKCKMHVADDAYAVQYVTQDGESYKFDDLGCMINYIKSNDPPTANIYVRDYDTLEWTGAKEAVYVFSRDIRTPMGNGVISFKNDQSAEAFMKEHTNSQIMDYSELLAFDWKNNKTK